MEPIGKPLITQSRCCVPPIWTSLDEDNNAVEGIPDRAISELLLQLSEAKDGNSVRRTPCIYHMRDIDAVSDVHT